MTSPQPNIFQDVLRTQLAFGIGGSGSRMLTNYIALNLYDKFVSSYQIWFPALHGFCCRRQKTQASTAPPPQNKDVKCTIECERNIPQAGSKQSGQTTNNVNHVRMDAVISYITTLPVIRNLLCMSHHEYLPHEFEPIQLEPDLYFQLLTLKHNEGQVETIRFKLFCYDHDMQYLQTFVDKCNHDYERRMANKLGTSLYYFDMMASTKGRNRSTQNPLPNTHLMYTKHKFYTTRTFDNVFFEQRQHVKNHVNFFLTRRDWYEAKGIPYTLGFLFHGPPGTGRLLQ